jgi:hypothetical protein
MTTPTLPPPPLLLYLCSKVQVTAKLEGQALVLLYLNKPLIEYGNGLEIFLENEAPVRVELVDFDQDGVRWEFEAKTDDGSSSGVAWNRGDGACYWSWHPTDELRVRVDLTVTAANTAEAPKETPLFIKVRPESARPWP